MNQTDKESKGKKVGADGLTKKERRALRIGSTTNSSQVQVNAENVSKTESMSSKPKDVPSVPQPGKKIIIKCENDRNDTTMKEVTEVRCNTDQGNERKELSKAELKAQRRAMQEAHRVAKAAGVKSKEQSDLDKKEKPEVLRKNACEEISTGVNKAELKAQRRAIQEAQRLAKTNLKVEQEKKQQNIKTEQKSKTVNSKVSSSKKESNESGNTRSGTINITGVHAAFLKLGAQYSSKTILGSNARCLALLSALKSLILDFTTPPKQELCRSLESTLQTCISHLNNCRPLAVSMTNALRHFKLHLTQIDTNLSDNEKKAKLLDCIEIYILDEINKAGEAISMQVRRKISNEDIILTYGCSSLITKILLDAYKEGKKFRVIVVDARPLLEGRQMLQKLVCAGIQCTYILINAASFVMSRVSKVLLGAHALLANGYVMSRTGTAQVALIANSYKKPVLVCCETYKFCERVQTDSFVYNEIGDPNQLVAIDTAEEDSPLASWKSSNYLTPLNLLYDVTPPDLVTAVVTELAFLPCTSVPVILRIRPTEILT